MTTTTQTKPLPTWLKLTDDAAIIALRKPSTINGIKVDTLTMRAPTVMEMRAANKQSGGDDEELEMALFCTLVTAGSADLGGLDLRDYKRLQVAYFRLGEDDGV